MHAIHLLHRNLKHTKLKHQTKTLGDSPFWKTRDVFVTSCFWSIASVMAVVASMEGCPFVGLWFGLFFGYCWYTSCIQWNKQWFGAPQFLLRLEKPEIGLLWKCPLLSWEARKKTCCFASNCQRWLCLVVSKFDLQGRMNYSYRLLPKMFQVAQALPGQNQQAPRLSLTGRVNGSQY